MISGRPWTEEDLHKLAVDRQLTTPELIESNDFYGHAAILKAYAGVQADYPLKTVVEHGVYIVGDDGWDVEWNCPLPMILFSSTQRYGPLALRTHKALFAIGPLIHYARPLLDRETFIAEKARLGKSLLVFPLHSSHWIKVEYDQAAHCRELTRVAGHFDSVRVCMYWKDILDGKARPYIEAGFECVTAGHMYDPRFLNRLRTLIALSDATASNELGTATGYSVALGKPHVIHKTTAGYHCDHAVYKSEIDVRRAAAQKHSADFITEAFSKMPAEITPHQLELANHYWGLDQVRTPAEIKTMIRIAHDISLQGRSYYLSGDDVLTKHALHCIKTEQHRDAAFLLDQAIRLHEPDRTFLYAKALACLGREQYNGAAELLARFQEQRPDHGPAGRLLEDLRAQHPQITGQDDIVIASYPLTENGQARRFLTDILFKMVDRKASIHEPGDQAADLPGSGRSAMDHIDCSPISNLKLTMSHNLHNPTPRKIIYIFGRAADVCWTNAITQARNSLWTEKGGLGPDQLCLTHLSEWQRHMTSYLDAAGKNCQRILFVSWEAFQASPVEQLMRIICFLGLPADRTACSLAVTGCHASIIRPVHIADSTVASLCSVQGNDHGSEDRPPEDVLRYVEYKSDRLYRQAMSLTTGYKDHDGEATFPIHDPTAGSQTQTHL